MKRIAFVFCSLLLLISCKKETVYRNGAPGELPAETQTGANTFGCLVNGRVWKPQGKPLDNVLDLSYDPTFNGGTMSIKAKRFSDSADVVIKEFMDIAMGQLSKEGTYPMDNAAQNAVGDYAYIQENKTNNNTIMACRFNPYQDKRTGTLTITKIDLNKGFISGRFEFALTKTNMSTGCLPVIRITQGRFDLKM